MNLVIKFIKENWFWIVPFIEVISTILILVLRKKPVKVVETLKAFVCRVLPALINEAEHKYGSGHGADKKAFVLQEMNKEIGEVFPGYAISPSDMKFILDQVEIILSTPSKK